MGNKKTNMAIYIVLLLLFLTLATSISFAWVLADPLAPFPQKGLDIAFINDAGDKVTDPVLSEGNAYPGWSKASVIKIKNFGAKARYKLGLDFIYDPSSGQPCLADVLSLKTVRNGVETQYRLVDFITAPLIDTTEINGGAVHELTVVLAMDESAGNEYENLSLDLKLNLYAEPITETHEPDHQNGGNGGSTVVVIPKTTPTPTPTPTPAAETPGMDAHEPEPLPDRGSEPEEDISIDTAVPQDTALPKTGGIPAALPIGVGILLICSGYFVRCKVKVKEVK